MSFFFLPPPGPFVCRQPQEAARNFDEVVAGHRRDHLDSTGLGSSSTDGRADTEKTGRRNAGNGAIVQATHILVANEGSVNMTANMFSDLRRVQPSNLIASLFLVARMLLVVMPLLRTSRCPPLLQEFVFTFLLRSGQLATEEFRHDETLLNIEHSAVLNCRSETWTHRPHDVRHKEMTDKERQVQQGLVR